ncbi:MAG: glycosyltransferase family 39 protein [Clostridia bacterium]|nr:glycosyltransferase family 39 protein [Clostridia bacterium]
MKEKVAKNIVNLLYYAIPMTLFLWYLQTIFNNSIWLDEAFSMSMIKQNFSEMIHHTSIDVHPPLYYILLKTIGNILEGILGNSIWAAKLVSCIPILLLIIVSNTTIKKMYGKKTAFLFEILILSVPQIMNYAIEIRMYSWGLFFVMMFYLYMMKWRKENRKEDLMVMTVFAILSAYTHYFALVPVACIYLYNFIEMIVSKDRNKLEIKNMFISILISCILYIPWLIVWIKQVLVVKENYWIGEITLPIFKSYFQFPYLVEENPLFTYLLGGILVLSIILLWIKRKEKDIWYGLGGFLAPIGTILIGVIASKLLRPIFIGRYIVCSLGCLWLWVAILLTKYSSEKEEKQILQYKNIGYGVLIIVLFIIAIANGKNLIHREKEYQQEINRTLSYIDTISDNILIFDGNQIQRVVAYYYPKTQTYVYQKDITELTKQVYRQTNMERIEQLEDIRKLDKNVYLFAIDKLILEELSKQGYQYKECGTYNIEHYKFSIYEILK